MAGGDASRVEYWHDAVLGKADTTASNGTNSRVTSAGWKSARPPPSMIRVPGLVHETSMLYMSDDLEKDPHAAVDSLYRPYKCDNVFVTGGAIFPTAGAWNCKCSYTALLNYLIVDSSKSCVRNSDFDDVWLRARPS